VTAGAVKGARVTDTALLCEHLFHTQFHGQTPSVGGLAQLTTNGDEVTTFDQQ
jgi:hypothetical protein